MSTGPSFGVHVAGGGNVFMREIAELVVAALHDLGRDAELIVDQLPAPAAGHVNLVVAPHELFTLLDATPRACREAARSSVCLGVEQPGTPWFEISAAYASLGPIVLDINGLAVDELRQRGVDARHLPIGYHESWDRWGGTAGARPIDVLFLGAATPQREAWLADNGRLLAEHECELRLFSFERPAHDGKHGFLVGDEKRNHIASARVLLNLHRGPVPYFEWVRAIEAIANGAVFVTETSTQMTPLVAGQHLVAADGDHLGAALEALLADEAHREQLAATAYAFLRERLHFTKLLDRALPGIEATAGVHRSGRSLVDLRTIARSQARRLGVEGRKLAGAAKQGAALRLRGNVIGELHDAHADLRQQLKGLTLANRRLQRQVEALDSMARFGEPDHVSVSSNDAYPDATPEITVVLPLYNYAHLVGAAIDSVVAATGVSAELVIVDDHSTDSSLAVALAKLDEHATFPMAVVAKASNAGLSAARNTGFELARAEMVFLLDADNSIYPRCLDLLRSALRDAPDDIAFTYGIVERHGDESSLISHLPWDVGRLCEGNYIDAMAMVRRSAWKAAGGYDPAIDERFGGWEDYEMWLHLAALGLSGELVPQVVARYWKHTGSMLSLLNLETESVRRELRARYPELPWPAVATA